MRALALVLIAVAVLAGCQKKEDFGTSEPLLSAADAAGAPMLKDGVWVIPEEGCDYDPNADEKGWPDCVRWFEVRGGQTRWGADDPFEPIVLAAGDPRLLQQGGGKSVFTYQGLRAISRDAGGRIVRASVWDVGCSALDKNGQSAPCNPRTAGDLRAMARKSDHLGADVWIWVKDAAK